MLVIDASVTVLGDTDTAPRYNLDSVDFEAASGATASKMMSTVTCQCMPDMSIHSSKKVFEYRVSECGHAEVTSTHAALMLLASRHATGSAADDTNARAQPQMAVTTSCVICCAKQADGAWCDCDVLKSSLVHIVNGTNLQESDIRSTQRAQLATLS